MCSISFHESPDLSNLAGSYQPIILRLPSPITEITVISVISVNLNSIKDTNKTRLHHYVSTQPQHVQHSSDSSTTVICSSRLYDMVSVIFFSSLTH